MSVCCVLTSPTTHVTGDVLDDPVPNGVNGEVNGVTDEHPSENGVTEDGEQEQPVQPEKVAKKIRVTYEEYKTIANLLILHLRSLEESSEEGVSIM